MACTVTWTTPMTVPMNKAVPPNTHGSSDKVKCGTQKARNNKPAVAARYPKEGNIAVRPVRVTNCPVISEPRPTPNISGSNKRPVSAGPVPRAARRYIGRNVISDTSAAPWQAARPALRQTEGSLNRRGGMSGEALCPSCQMSSSSDTMPSARRPRISGSQPALIR